MVPSRSFTLIFSVRIFSPYDLLGPHRVMRGLDPRIHDAFQRIEPCVCLLCSVIMDCRVKPGNDASMPPAQLGYDAREFTASTASSHCRRKSRPSRPAEFPAHSPPPPYYASTPAPARNRTV